MSANHPQVDATERDVMIQTYLSLIDEEKLADDDRKLMIATVFRPSRTGLIKEEGGPPNAFGAVMKPFGKE